MHTGIPVQLHLFHEIQEAGPLDAIGKILFAVTAAAAMSIVPSFSLRYGFTI